MNFPDTVEIEVLDNNNRLPLHSVAITLKFFAVHKNNYYVGSLITSQSGLVRFSRSYCKQSIESARRMFIMDYEDDLEDCRPTIEVLLHPPEFIRHMFDQYHSSPEFWRQAVENPEEYFGSLVNTRNAEFEAEKIIVSELELRENCRVGLYLRNR